MVQGDPRSTWSHCLAMGLTWRLLQHVWGNREGYVFTPRKRNGVWGEMNGLRWPLPEGTSFNIRTDFDQYWSPLVFSNPKRRAEYALPTHVLWSDLDDVDPEQCALRPSAAWKTTQGVYSMPDTSYGPAITEIKPHWQALWFLGEEVEAQEAAQLSKRIAYAEGADKGGWDVTQVLRLPGTYNHKHSPPHKVEMLWAEKRYYTVAQVEAAYPPVPDRPLPLPVYLMLEAGQRREVDKAIAALPMGVRMSLERPTYGADRSLELLRLATELLRFGCPPELVPAVLARTTLAQEKYGGRNDMERRLLQTTADALIVVNKEVRR